MLKILNFYNYSHVTPLRKVKQGRSISISPNVWFAEPERIEIGDNAHLGGRCMIWAGPTVAKIVIGADALFGPEVMITAASYRYNDGPCVTKQNMNEADVIIGRDVWLATRVVVLPGTTIGDGCIVAAGAVLSGTYPAMSIIAGAPAKVVSTRRIGDTDHPGPHQPQ
ncbi:acyltransferase [uncultured Tateyamaria sp.]|uniref:acyltransferase n=1 Tax=uncultured Tateyamaria sp. TaxID=455651 RepID=UPI0026364C9B|nr:acyltransferase [uncultured Tateyamaria sp.]